jgi:ribosomal protein L20
MYTRLDLINGILINGILINRILINEIAVNADRRNFSLEIST